MEPVTAPTPRLAPPAPVACCLRLSEHRPHHIDGQWQSDTGLCVFCSGHGLATYRQVDVFRFISVYRLLNGYAPSVREIARDQGIASTNGVYGHLDALERKGLLERDRGIARGIRITPLGHQLLDELEQVDPLREAS